MAEGNDPLGDLVKLDLGFCRMKEALDVSIIIYLYFKVKI